MAIHPREQGYKFSQWNAVNVSHHIQTKFGKMLSIRTANRILHRQGFRLIRPRPIPSQGDPVRQQEFYDNLRERIRNSSRSDAFLFFDACSVIHQPTITRMWAITPSRPELKMRMGGQVLKIMGCLDASNGRAFFAFVEQINKENLSIFLWDLLRIYPYQRIHLILDNASPHHSYMVQNFVLGHSDRLELIFLPPYSPKLNPIEKFWAFFRRNVTHNTYYPTFIAFKDEIVEFLTRFKRPHPELRQFARMYFNPIPTPLNAM